MHTETWIQDAWDAACNKIQVACRRIGSGFPHGSQDGKFQLTQPDYWTAGFWPGLLWLVYRDNNNEELRQLADQCEEKLDKVLHDYEALSHDMGFMWTLTSIANWQITQNTASRRRAITAASHLVGRFNLKGSFIRAWNQPERTGWAIIDCMMNLPLLYWASAQTGDPRFRHVAEAHAEMSVQHFIRADGSTYHVVCFDPETGKRAGVRSGQGYAEESAWSRGTAWAIYGSVLSYLHTGRHLFLEAATRTADFFLHQLPSDMVPYWDFRLPSMTDAPRDSSAAAIAACGLIDLSAVLENDKGRFYKTHALSILESLTSRYRADSSEEALLLSGTGNLPAGQNINKPLIYGDYYYVEALSKLRGQHTFWEPGQRLSQINQEINSQLT